MFDWLLLIGFIALTIFHSIWYLIGVAVVGLWKFNKWRICESRPWRKVHFPMCRAYLDVLSTETKLANDEGRDVDSKTVLKGIFKIVNPDIKKSSDALIDQEYGRDDDSYDRKLAEHFLSKQKYNQEKIQSYLELIRKDEEKSENAVVLKTVIAAVIEDRFSSEARGEYMFHVFTGKI